MVTEVNAPVAAIDMAELLASPAHGGRVDDGCHLGQVVYQYPVVERDIPVSQRCQEDVLFQGVRFSPEVFHDPLFLLFNIIDVRR